MATGSVAGRADGVVNSAYGSLTGDGTATTISLGFTPRQIIVVNETDAIRWEKIGDMVAANSTKLVGGTVAFTVDTTSAITVSGGVMTLSAALAATGKAIKWYAAA